MIVHVIWTSDIFVLFLFLNLVLDKINFNLSFEVEIVMQTYIFFSKARLLNRWIEELCQNKFWFEVHVFRYLPLNKGKVYYTGNILHMYKINNTYVLLPISLNKEKKTDNVYYSGTLVYDTSIKTQVHWNLTQFKNVCMKS